jgi:hypothetical protein
MSSFSKNLWHTSPFIDVSAYAFSWVWILVPLLLSGANRHHDYVALYFFVLVLNDVHRHFSLPYVYLDARIRRLYPWRFIGVPLVLCVLWFSTPYLNRVGWYVEVFSGAQIRVRAVLNALVVAAAFWTVWHVYMQKYGIMRMYNMKSGCAKKIPEWVDRWMVCGWVPLYFAWLGPHFRDVVVRNFPRGKIFLVPLLDALTAVQCVFVPLAVACVVCGLVFFVYYEHSVYRLKNTPRLWMAFGTTLLSGMFLICDPIKVYLAFGFSHAVEYMVFVWAFQKKRYAVPLAHKPLLGRLLQKPFLFYASFILILGGVLLFFGHWGADWMPDQKQPRWLGYSTAEWVRCWTVYQSMMHFYFDGFLWKMHQPSVRAMFE